MGRSKPYLKITVEPIELDIGQRARFLHPENIPPELMLHNGENRKHIFFVSERRKGEDTRYVQQSCIHCVYYHRLS